jgi:ATP-dependent Clp protease ATP-binding subunit ClpA
LHDYPWASPSSRAILAAAAREARALGHEHVEVGHLLLAMLTDDSSDRSSQVLRGHDVSTVALRQKLLRAVAANQDPAGSMPPARLPITSWAKQVLVKSQAGAAARNASDVELEDMLRVVLREEFEPAATALIRGGVTLDLLERAFRRDQQRH